VAVATTLADDHAVILRANGCLAIGATPLEALTRLYYLEERAEVALSTTREPAPVEWHRRLGDTAAELRRAMAWVEAAFGDV
jgi:ribulose-5-phosphate 4-epimerase/fuculose-1-phosphate aldolase